MQNLLNHAVSLDADVIASLRRAIELGKFPDGRRLTAEESGMCMQVVIAWEVKHLSAEQRTAYIDRGSKQEGESCASDHEHAELNIPMDPYRRSRRD
ncbi:MAG: DUF1315 family protein [Pseudomonadales bacterium]|nr:DUF1315 family protein [Pseudomonadales bacterium]